MLRRIGPNAFFLPILVREKFEALPQVPGAEGERGVLISVGDPPLNKRGPLINAMGQRSHPKRIWILALFFSIGEIRISSCKASEGFHLAFRRVFTSYSQIFFWPQNFAQLRTPQTNQGIGIKNHRHHEIICQASKANSPSIEVICSSIKNNLPTIKNLRRRLFQTIVLIGTATSIRYIRIRTVSTTIPHSLLSS